MNKFNDQIQKLEHKRAQIKAQIQILKCKEHEAENKELHKKHIIIGKLIMAEMENDENYSEKILAQLSDSLKKFNDRMLFDLQRTQTNHDNSTIIKNTDGSEFIKHDEASDLHCIRAL